MNHIGIKLNYQKILTFKNLLLFFVLLLLIPKSIFTIPGIGLDNSWKISINLATRENLVFGKDYVFTYGPLGYLSTGLSIYTSELLIVLFYLFVALNGIYFIYYLFKSIDRKIELIFLVITLIFFGHFLFWRNTIPLYFYFIFHIFHYLKHKNLYSLITASLICLLAFYIKVNTGLIVNILFLIFIIYNFLFKTLDYYRNTLLFAGHFLILFLLSFPLNTAIVSYISHSIQIINSYNDAMVLFKYKTEFYIAASIILFLVSIIIFSLKRIIRSYFEIFLFSNISLMIFILFKQAFVRSDLHINLFFSGISFIMIMAFTFSEIKKFKMVLYYGIIITTILSIYAHVGPIKSLDFGKWFSSQSNEMIESRNQNKRKLPQSVMKLIGDKSVDVLGYEISYIYYNDLKYNPRPVVQSYNAYDKKLININYNKYNSNSAPDYLLYHYGSIDDRHDFWDEPKIYLAIFKNYTIIDTIRGTKGTKSLILFKKNSISQKIEEKIIVDTLIHFNSKFNIPVSNNILYLTLDYNYTIIGEIKRIIFQPSLVYMNLAYEDLDSTFCRLILPVMKSGVPINKKVINDHDAYTFFNSRGKENKNATFLKLVGNPIWINDLFRIRITEYEILEK